MPEPTQQQINDCLAAADVWNEKERLLQRATDGVNETQYSYDDAKKAFARALRFDESAKIQEAILTLLVELPKSLIEKNAALTAAQIARDVAKTAYDDALAIVQNPPEE